MARSSLNIGLIAAAVVLLFAYVSAEMPPCNQITQMITPCISYLTGRAPSPAGPCCMGVTALKSTASTHNDRVAICSCLKSVAPQFQGVNFSRASDLPTQCGVKLEINIDPSIDCNKIPVEMYN